MSNTNIPLSFKLGSGNLPTGQNITNGTIYLKQNTNNNKYTNFNLYYGTDTETIIPLNIDQIATTGENKMTNTQYCELMTDLGPSIGCSLKNARALDNQLIVGEILLPLAGATDYSWTPSDDGTISGVVGNKPVANYYNGSARELSIYTIEKAGNPVGFITEKKLIGKFTVNGWEGNVIGNTSTATKLTTSAGSSTQPVYFSSEGKPVATTYKLEQSVPSNAKFTDTTYTAGKGLSLTNTEFSISNNVLTTDADQIITASKIFSEQARLRVDTLGTYTDPAFECRGLSLFGAPITLSNQNADDIPIYRSYGTGAPPEGYTAENGIIVPPNIGQIYFQIIE